MSKWVAELEARCAEAYAEGLARDTPTVDLNERFNVRLLTGLFTRVPVAETIALLQASRLRSDALTLARAGTLEAAGRLLQAAESLGAREILAEEAHLVDESYQRSATAFMLCPGGTMLRSPYRAMAQAAPGASATLARA